MDTPALVLVLFALMVLLVIWDVWGYRYRVPAVEVVELLEPGEYILTPLVPGPRTGWRIGRRTWPP